MSDKPLRNQGFFRFWATVDDLGYKTRYKKQWLITGDNDKPFWICGRIDVTARARDVNGREWGLMLLFTDIDGNRCEWFVPRI